MKKLNILVVMILVTQYAFSQNSTTMQPVTSSTAPPSVTYITPSKIEYQFDQKKLIKPSLSNIKADEFYQVYIHGINLNLYKVSINTKDSTTAKPLQMPTLTGLDLDGITKAISGIKPASTFYTIYKNDTSAPGFAPGNKTKIPIGKKPSPVGPTMLKYKQDLNVFLSNLTSIKQRIDDLIFNIYQYQLDQQQTVPAGTSTYSYAKALRDIIQLRSDITTLLANITSSQKAYAIFEAKYKDEIAKNEDLTASDKAIIEAYTKLITGCSDAQAAVAADKSRDLLAGLITSANNSGMEYISLPFQFKKDQATMSLTIEPRKPEYGLNTYNQDIVFPLQQRSYAAVGVSFYGASLHDEPYSIVGTDSTHYAVKPEKWTKAEVGVTALLRLGTKFSDISQAGMHFSIGPGLSIASSIKPRLLTGIGFSYGSKHMFTFDAGAIFGYVDRVSSAIDLNSNQLSVKPDNIMVSKLNGGYFGAIGYLYRF